ncbi:hypothetical protein [Portibacter marinus]|uniref:hypothetical protein n=1 Tax=Portibacter marinus TaxID=2898660 RepID=UPI001F38F68E|nr:hypothetical protein [Portibacter marinus]
MYKYILESAGNINWMALFALLTFMFVFIVSAILIFTKNKKTIQHISHLPLVNEEDLNIENRK